MIILMEQLKVNYHDISNMCKLGLEAVVSISIISYMLIPWSLVPPYLFLIVFDGKFESAEVHALL